MMTVCGTSRQRQPVGGVHRRDGSDRGGGKALMPCLQTSWKQVFGHWVKQYWGRWKLDLKQQGHPYGRNLIGVNFAIVEMRI